MAWRIHENVWRGEVDNRTRGRVTGRVWLAGVAEPIVLDLAGDCHPDLAGCLLCFENPKPVPLNTPPPACRQRGTAGDITAARKVRVFDLPIEEACAMLRASGTPPEHLASGIYIEWFSDLSGHFIIEIADYHLEISAPAWRFSAEELSEHSRLAAAADGDVFAIEISADETEEKWDEFRCEQFLRESDARTERYGALLKKYGDHPDAERIIAREMGWTWLEEALDDDPAMVDPAEDPPAKDETAFHESDGFDEPPPDPAREGIDWVRNEEGRLIHPLQKRADDALHALLDELKSAGHFPGCDDAALGDFVGHFMNLTAKLAGALGAIARDWHDVEPGMTIARLKRILTILNDTLTAAGRVEGKYLSPDPRAQHRAALLVLREEIIALTARLRARA